MKFLKAVGIVILSVLLAIPPTFFATFGNAAMLRDIEKRWDIEVIGHSGPADWVIWTIWVVFSLAIAGTIMLMRSKTAKAK